MPEPNAGESKDDFMKRCIPMLIEEGREQDQAVAVCASMFEDRDKAGRRLNSNKVGFLKGLQKRLREISKALSELAGWADYADQPRKEGGLMLWKEANGYRWLAAYSNHFKDNDNPPEIISSASHERYVEMVDSGQYSMPELWHFHLPGTKWGSSDWVAYDKEAGFALASGMVDAGHEAEAEAIAQLGDYVALSHGMPRKSLRYDDNDRSIITEHQTIEISTLPRQNAANKLTSFEVIEEDEMTIPDEKKEFLRQVGLTDEKIGAIEQALEGRAKEATEAGVQFKDADPAPEPAPVVDTPAPAVEPTPPAAPALTAEAIAAAVSASINDALAPLTARLDALEGEAKARKEQEAILTPAASLYEMITASVIGKKETRIPKNDELAKAGPKETAGAANLTGIDFIDAMLAGK